MKKLKGKLFGIGATVLFVILAMGPIVHSENETVYIESEIETIFQSYEDELSIIEQFMTAYIVEHGEIDDDFSLPPDLQEIYDTITNEFINLFEIEFWQLPSQGQTLDISQNFDISMVQTSVINGAQVEIVPIGGGINKVKGPYQYFILFDWGIYFEIWLDDDTTGSLNYAQLVPILLGALGPVGIVVAIMMAGSIIYIQSANNGNGVIFDGRISFNPFLPRFYVANARPQSSYQTKTEITNYHQEHSFEFRNIEWKENI